MRFVIQRVTEASVSVDDQIIGSINRGYMVLIGVADGDTKEMADKLIAKMIKLRIFEDENGKTNLDLNTVGGDLLLVSQFTLYADCKKGNRPSFIKSGPPDKAEEMYNYIVDECRKNLPDKKIETGSFGAYMMVKLTNDGPFTIILDSNELM